VADEQIPPGFEFLARRRPEDEQWRESVERRLEALEQRDH
jgi:hypothetical protein